MAQVGRARLLQLPRGTGEPRHPVYLSGSADPPVAHAAAASQSTPPLVLGSDGKTGCPLVARPARAPSLAERAVCRYASALGAVCANQRPYGSVRGVRGDPHPHRDKPECL
ncbi:hypothetical protein SBA2_540002 [Acidobacteriia bacterium SbA2]|nr:hypothetical protein SBA2_540002 [Acidobacteriia bacterium SbA2]